MTTASATKFASEAGLAGTLSQSFRRRHRWFEDVMALGTGALFISFAAYLIKEAGLLTGGVLGVGYLAHYATGWPLGTVFFALNVPFYWLGFIARGLPFILKTVATVGLASVLVEQTPAWAKLHAVSAPFAAVMGGALAGIGSLALFRHNASFGGFGILALHLQRQRGWRAGHILLLADAGIFAVAMCILPIDRVWWSVACSIVLNVTVALNHRADRYLGH